MYKVPYTLVIGEKEISSSVVSPRIREDLRNNAKEVTMKIDKFLEIISTESRERVSKSTF
jgi:threonyl-tRNA synthetase